MAVEASPVKETVQAEPTETVEQPEAAAAAS